MGRTRVEGPRLARVSKIGLALPEATRWRHGDHAGFVVRKRTFAYYLHNHHGDGIISVCCKVMPGDNTALASAQPSRFYIPAYIGPRGWVGLRLDTGKIDWEEVAALVVGSYHVTAPSASPLWSRRPRIDSLLLKPAAPLLSAQADIPL